jgi:hypothetical protein
MDKLGLLLKIECIKQDIIETLTDKKKREFLTYADYKFTWIDVETGERESCLWCSQGTDGSEKGIGSCHTYAERMFLIKFFHIVTSEDAKLDPDFKSNLVKGNYNSVNETDEEIAEKKRLKDIEDKKKNEEREKQKKLAEEKKTTMDQLKKMFTCFTVLKIDEATVRLYLEKHYNIKKSSKELTKQQISEIIYDVENKNLNFDENQIPYFTKKEV